MQSNKAKRSVAFKTFFKVDDGTVVTKDFISTRVWDRSALTDNLSINLVISWVSAILLHKRNAVLESKFIICKNKLFNNRNIKK